MMEDQSDSFYPGEEFIFITTKSEEQSVPRTEADPRKTQAEMFKKDPFVDVDSLSGHFHDTISLSADSSDRVRNPGKDPDVPGCSRLRQSKVLSFLAHNTVPFVACFMADYGEYGSMVVDVAHSDTLLATDFPFTNTASKLDQHGDVKLVDPRPCCCRFPYCNMFYLGYTSTADYGEYGGLYLAAPAHTGKGDTCMSRNYDSLLRHVGPNTELDLYRELHAQVSYRSVLLPPALYRQDLMLRLQDTEAQVHLVIL